MEICFQYETRGFESNNDNMGALVVNNYNSDGKFTFLEPFKNGSFQFNVLTDNGTIYTGQYSLGQTVSGLLQGLIRESKCTRETKPNILVASLYTSQNIINERYSFSENTLLGDVLNECRKNQSSLQDSYISLSASHTKYAVKVYFNSFVRSFLGLPFRAMSFYVKNEEEPISSFIQEVLKDISLQETDSRFWLYANYASLEKIYAIPAYELVLDINQDCNAFFQFQFTDAAISTIMSVQKCGYLFMKTKRFFNLVDKRWCSLSNNTLLYSRSPGERVSKSLLHLDKAILRLIENPIESENGNLYGLEIVVPNARITSWVSKIFIKKNRRLVLFSHSKDELLQWKNSIENINANVNAIKLIREVETDASMPESTTTVISKEHDLMSRTPNSSGYNEIEAIYSILDPPQKKSIDRIQIDGDCFRVLDYYTDENMMTHLKQKSKSHFVHLDDNTEMCCICRKECINPLKLEGGFPVHFECFNCYKCKELPIDYVVVSDSDAMSGPLNNSNFITRILCSKCYQKYSPKCAICHQNIISGLLERMNDTFHAGCYFSCN